MRRAFVILEEESGRPLASVLEDRVTGDPAVLLDAGAVFVDRRRMGSEDAARPLASGARVEVEDTPDAPLQDLMVLYEDSDLAFVLKPTGVSSTGDLRGTAGTLVAACEARFGSAHLAGRLDREASGVVLVLRSALARRAVPVLRREGKVARTYVTLCGSKPAQAIGAISLAIGPDPRRGTRQRVGGPGARPAETPYEATPLGNGAEILARPRTGRTHQVRLHLSTVGAPVLGDRLYSGAVRLIGEGGRIVRVERLALHCREIHLPHPRHGKTVSGWAALPEDLSGLRTSLAEGATPAASPSGVVSPSAGGRARAGSRRSPE